MGLAACAPKSPIIPYVPPRQRVTRAPASQNETGVIVLGLSTATLEQLIGQYRDLSVRIVNPKHGLYELFGQSLATVRRELRGQNVLIEKNSYVPLIKKSKVIDDYSNTAPFSVVDNPLVFNVDQYQKVFLTGADLNFVNSCRLGPSNVSPVIHLMSNQGTNLQQTWFYFNLGNSINLDASNSQAPTNDGKLSYLWIVTAPQDSLLQPQYSRSATIRYTPDTTGLHRFTLIVKDSNGYCQPLYSHFFVSAKVPFEPGPAFPASLSSTFVTPNRFLNLFRIGATKAWKLSTGKGITIAIIDSGVNYNHPALSPNIWINRGEIPNNGIDDDGDGFVDDVVGYNFAQNNPYPYDDYGHGSHVAGIAASSIFGAARGAKIMPLKVTIFASGFDIATVAGAIYYAVDQGAKIINLSMGWPNDYPVMRRVLKYTEQKDVLLTVSAGNSSTNNDVIPQYPASYRHFPNIISVAASNYYGALTSYSNYGPETVDIAAPGGTTKRPIISAYKENPRHELYAKMAGTSMASPLVAGVAAQVWSEDRHLTDTEVKQILLETGEPSAALKNRIKSGRVLNAQAAVKYARNLNGPSHSVILTRPL